MKRPVPTPKADSELDNFINEATSPKQEKASSAIQIQKQAREEEKIRKSLVLSKRIDDALRLESATTREKQIDIMEKAIGQYLKKKGHKNI